MGSVSVPLVPVAADPLVLAVAAVIGTYGSRIEARIALHSERLIRGESHDFAT